MIADARSIAPDLSFRCWRIRCLVGKGNVLSPLSFNCQDFVNAIQRSLAYVEENHASTSDDETSGIVPTVPRSRIKTIDVGLSPQTR